MEMIQQLRNQLEQEKGRRKHLEEAIVKSKEQLTSLNRDKINTEQAQIIIQEVAKKTQEQVAFHISGIVSMALAAIFDDPYEFKIRFVTRRGRTEADLLLERDGVEIDPMGAVGGGVIDVVSFALRVALWSIAVPKLRAVLILDEPFKFLSRGYQPKASAMIQEISKKLGIQFIIVSHDPAIIASADKTFQVQIQDGISLISEDENGKNQFPKG